MSVFTHGVDVQIKKRPLSPQSGFCCRIAVNSVEERMADLGNLPLGGLILHLTRAEVAP